MTKWICKECGTIPCRLDDGDATLSPDRCPITNMRPCWKRDCTEEKKDDLKITDKNILDVLQSMNRRIAYAGYFKTDPYVDRLIKQGIVKELK